MVVTETIAGLSAVKAAFDLAKSLKEINDAAVRNGVVIELQEKILSAQEAQTALIERISNLEKEVAGFEKWDTEKEKYELKEIYPSSFAYSIKEDTRGAEPPHLICANCYEQRRKSILQKHLSNYLKCANCDSVIISGKPPSITGRVVRG